MSVEVILFLAGLWVLLGLIDAWVLRQLGRSGWRLLLLCAVSGPLSLSIVYDEVRPAGTDGTAATSVEPLEQSDPAVTPDQSPAMAAYEAEGEPDEPVQWPVDDPASPMMLHGYRSIADH